MFNLPNFNQLVHTFERFDIPNNPGVWPKSFPIPDHRILLPTSIHLRVSTSALAADRRIRIYLGTGATKYWDHVYDHVITANLTVFTYIFPLMLENWPLYAFGDATLPMPDNIYLYSANAIEFELESRVAGDEISQIFIAGKTWIS